MCCTIIPSSSIFTLGWNFLSSHLALSYRLPLGWSPHLLTASWLPVFSYIYLWFSLALPAIQVVVLWLLLSVGSTHWPHSWEPRAGKRFAVRYTGGSIDRHRRRLWWHSGKPSSFMLGAKSSGWRSTQSVFVLSSQLLRVCMTCRQMPQSHLPFYSVNIY